MVDDVPKLRAEPELHGFRDVQVLVNSEVEVVGPRRLQGVPACVRQRARTSSNVLRIRIVGHIGHNRTSIRSGNSRQR